MVKNWKLLIDLECFRGFLEFIVEYVDVLLLDFERFVLERFLFVYVKRVNEWDS